MRLEGQILEVSARKDCISLGRRGDRGEIRGAEGQGKHLHLLT